MITTSGRPRFHSVCRRLLSIGAIALVFFATGCFWGKRPAPDRTPTTLAVDEERLARDLREFQLYSKSRIEHTSDDIAATTRRLEVRRAAILWKTRMVDSYQERLSNPDPVAALTEAWILSLKQGQYLLTGEGKALFGTAQPIAIGAATEFVARIEAIAQSQIPPERFEALQKSVIDLANANPMTGVFEEPTGQSLTFTEAGRQTLSFLASIPAAPLRAAESVGGRVSTLTSIPGMVERISGVVEDFPEELRWQSELLLANLESNDAVTSALLNFEQLSQSFQRIAAVSEGAPQQLRTLIDQTMDHLSSQQHMLARNLAEANLLAERTIVVMDRTKATGETWEKTAAAVSITVADLDLLINPPDAGPPSPDGDFLTRADRTSKSLANAAVEVRSSIQEIQKLIDGPALPTLAKVTSKEADEILLKAELRSKRLIDRLFLRTAALLLIAFVLLVLYELVRRRLRRAEHPSGK